MAERVELHNMQLSYIFDGTRFATTIANMLNEVAQHCNSTERFNCHFNAPTAIEAEHCYTNNYSLWGQLVITSDSANNWNPVEIPILYPWHGVFVVASGSGLIRRPATARLKTWRPCLIQCNGLALQYTVKNRVAAWYHTLSRNPTSKIRTVNLPRYVAPTIEHVKNQIPELGNQLDQLQTFLLDISNLMLDDAANSSLNKQLEELKQKVIDLAKQKLLTHSDNLEYQRLCTYEVFLSERFVNLICNKWFSEQSQPQKKYWQSEINGRAIWEDASDEFLKPKHGKYTWLNTITPQNSIELISRLTELSRYGLPRKDVERWGLDKRQNRPEYWCKICPVQTPESEMIGITLNTAAGVTVDGTGELHPSPKSHGLGHSASLIPFYQHTDAARAMIASKGYTQALALDNAEKPLVATGHEDRIRTLLEPPAPSYSQSTFRSAYPPSLLFSPLQQNHPTPFAPSPY